MSSIHIHIEKVTHMYNNAPPHSLPLENGHFNQPVGKPEAKEPEAIEPEATDSDSDSDSDSEPEATVTKRPRQELKEIDYNDVTGYSPQWMEIEENKDVIQRKKKDIHFAKKRWTEVIVELIRALSMTRAEFEKKIHVTRLDELPVYHVEAVYGRHDFGYYTKPERNGWVYIEEIDISIRIRPDNQLLEMFQQLVKGTKYEDKICICLNNNYERSRYRFINF